MFEAIANRQRVQQRLRRMFVRAIACVDITGTGLCFATKLVALELAWRIMMQSGFDRVEGVDGIQKRFAFPGC